MFGRRRIESVEAGEAARLHEGGAVLLDVREGSEWAAGHAPRAVHIPLGELASAIERLRDREVVTVCRSGARSADAAARLAAAGIHARNVVGGMSSWARAGLPVVRGDGRPGQIV